MAIKLDLNKWGLQKFSRFSDHCRNFQEFLGEVLDGERDLLAKPPAHEGQGQSPTFKVRDDIELLVSSPAPARGNHANTETLFTSLAPYFEAGFYLREGGRGGQDQRMLEMFLFGHVFLAPEPGGSRVHLTVPPMQPGQVMKGAVKPVLKLFHLDTLSALGDASAFVVRPRAQETFLLVCNRPHPWQVGFVEKTRDVLIKLLEPSEKLPAPKVSPGVSALSAAVKSPFRKGLFK